MTLPYGLLQEMNAVLSDETRARKRAEMKASAHKGRRG